jgi:sugar/nucleoside kinase (ribokinase family)
MNNDLSTGKVFDVLVAGELNVDLILNQIEKFPIVGKEVLAHKMTLTLGSSSAIFASNLSTLGSRVAFSGKLGIDDFGNHMLASLEARGVNTSNIIRSSHVATGASIVLNFGEDRAMVTHQGAMADFGVNDIPEKALLQSRHLHVSSVFLQPILKEEIVTLYRKAKALGLTTSLDPQWDPAEQWAIDFPNLLSYVDVFMPNAQELEGITKIKDIKAAVQSLPTANILVVKNGSEGACLWNGKEFLNQRSFLNHKVVDSIGAGDSFDAGFIHKFIQQRPLQECLEFAALTGAINTTRAGGTTAFENINTAREIAQTSFNYNF